MELIPVILSAIGDIALWLFCGPWSGRRDEPRPTGKIERGQRSPKLRVRQICAYCGKKGGVFVACARCRAPHHADCARLNLRCAVWGCVNREFRVPAA